MTRLLFLLFLGAIAWAGYRLYQRERKRVADTLDKAKAELDRRDDSGENKPSMLEKDPETGVYRPVSDDDDQSRK